MLDESENASVPCELAAAARARSASVKMGSSLGAVSCIQVVGCDGQACFGISFFYFLQFYSSISGKQVILKEILCSHIFVVI